jgi:hypothetical protein
MILLEARDCIGPEVPERINRSKVGNFLFERKSSMTRHVAPSRQKRITKGSWVFGRHDALDRRSPSKTAVAEGLATGNTLESIRYFKSKEGNDRRKLEIILLQGFDGGQKILAISESASKQVAGPRDAGRHRLHGELGRVELRVELIPIQGRRNPGSGDRPHHIRRD